MSPTRIAAVPLLGLLLALGCASPEEKKAEHLSNADAFHAEEDHRSELIELMNALKTDPTAADVNLRIARAHEALGNAEKAFFYFGEAYRLDPNLTEAALAQLPLLSVGDPEAAEALIESIREREPDNATALVRKAELKLLRSDTDAALEAALTAAELAPDQVISQRSVGTVYRSIIREKQLAKEDVDASLFDAAIEAFGRAEALPHEDGIRGRWYDRHQIALTWGTRGDEYSEQVKQALYAAWDLATEEEQGSGQASVSRSAIEYGTTRRDQPLMRWGVEKRLEVAPRDVGAWAQLAQLAEAEGGDGDAVWQEVLERKADDLRIHLGWIRYLQARERTPEAIRHLEALREAGGPLSGGPELASVLVELHLHNEGTEQARSYLAEMQEKHPEDTLTGLAEARVLLFEQKGEEAAAILRDLAEFSERADVTRQLAVAEWNLGNAEAALKAIDRTLELDPQPAPQIHRLRLRIQAAQRDWQAVLATFRYMARNGFPLRAPERVYRARALYETGRPDMGRRILDAMLGTLQPPLDVYLVFAHYEIENDKEKVREVLNAALDHYPDHHQVVSILADLDVAEGNAEEALARLDAMDHLSPQVRLKRARLLANAGRMEEAENEAIAVFASHPTLRGAGNLLVSILTVQGRRDEAIQALEEARGKGMLAGPQTYLLARLYLESGQLEASIPPLEEALRTAPELAAVRNDLAYVLAETGRDLDRAYELAREAKQGRPEDPAVADTLGWVYYRRGLFEPAAVELRAAIDLAADTQRGVPADFHYHLGLVLVELGRNDEAAASFDKALTIHPDHEGAKQARAAVANTTAGG